MGCRLRVASNTLLEGTTTMRNRGWVTSTITVHPRIDMGLPFGPSGSPITGGGSAGKKRGLAAPSRGSPHRLKSPKEMASINARQRILLISSLLAEIPLRLARLHLRSAGPPEKAETPTGQASAAPSGSPKGPGWDEGKRPLGHPEPR